MGVAPPWYCHALVLPAEESWLSELSAEVSFVSVLAMVLSENWKRLEGFFLNFIIFMKSRIFFFFLKFSSSLFQYSESTIPSTVTYDTSAESPWSQLYFDTLKMGVASSGGRHASSPRKAYFVDFLRARGGFLTLCLLWHRHALMIIPCPYPSGFK